MKFIKRVLPVVLCGCMCLPMAACGDGSKDGSDTMNTSAARAAQLADNVFEKYIDQALYTLDRNDSDWELFVYDGYSHEYESGEGGASVWHYTAVYSLANRMYSLYQGTEKGDEYKQLMDDLYEELAWYRGTGTFVEFTGTEERTVYGVNRSNIGRDRAGVEGTLNVYDDQMWLLREMLESYDLTGEEKYLEEAEYLANYCLAGWDCSLDEYGNEYGGILWGPGYQSRHTCSNGPIISPLVWLYEVYKDSDETIEYKYQNEKHEVVSETMKKSDYYLMFAKKVYNYTIQYLKKANDLFYDNKGYNVATWEETGVKYTYYTDGKYQPESLTYNSGSPLSGAVDLYRVTGDETYLEQARKIAAAAYDYFADETFKEDVVRYPTNSITTWFNFVLYRGFYDLYNVWQSETSRKYIDSFRDLIDYAYDNYYRDGFLPRDLAGGWHTGYEYDEVSNVMDAASAAETMALAAQLEIRYEDLI